MPENDDRAERKQTRRELNKPLLLWTLIAVAVTLPSLYAVWAYQVTRVADALIRRAEALERNGEWKEAASFFRRYLRLHPDDIDVWTRLPHAYLQAATTDSEKAEAVQLFYRALGLVDGESETNARRLRTELADLLLQLSETRNGCAAQARTLAERLLRPDNPNAAWRELRSHAEDLPFEPPADSQWWLDHPEIWSDPTATRIWVLAIDKLVAEGTFEGETHRGQGLGKHFLRAIALSPDDIELSSVVARLWRDHPFLCAERGMEITDELRQEQATLADSIVDEMVSRNDQDPRAYLARHTYRLEHGLPGAKADLARAAELGPDVAEVLLAGARAARVEALERKRSGATTQEIDAKYGEALQWCKRAIEVAPEIEAAHIALGDVWRARGRNDRAIEAWQQGLSESDRNSIALHWRLADVLIAEERLADAKKHLDVIENQYERLSPRLTQTSRLLLSGNRDLLHGQWLMAHGEYAEAIAWLKHATTGSDEAGWENTRKWRAWHLLAAIYATLGQWDLAAAAHEEVSKLQPADALKENKTATLKAAADAWSMAGNPVRAIPLYERALQHQDDPQTWLSLAAARLQKQAALPGSKRDWTGFDEALSELKTRSPSLPNPWQIAILEAESIAAKTSDSEVAGATTSDAVEVLRRAEEEFPDSVALARELTTTYERLGAPADAERALTRFERISNDRAAAVLLRSSLYSARKDFDRARELIESALESVPQRDRERLRRQLARLEFKLGHADKSDRRLLAASEVTPGDVSLIWELAQHALRRGDFEEVAHWEDELRLLEGDSGTFWRYCRARRLLANAEGDDDSRLADASKLQKAILIARPAWPAGHELAGLLAERFGRSLQAIEAYEAAVRCGADEAWVYERLIRLLYEKGEFGEARSYLQRIQDHIPAHPALSELDVAVAVQLGNRSEALSAARDAVAARPNDLAARIRLGDMLRLNGVTAEAEAEFKKAREMAPEDRRALEALFQFYVAVDRPDEAKETLAELAKSPALSESERLLALASGLQLLGDRDEAAERYAELADLSRNDVAVQKQLAASLRESDPLGAEKALRRVLELSPEDRETRRSLAALLAARGPENWPEIERLIGQGLSDDKSGVGMRLEAMLRVQRGGKANLAEALRLLETLVKRPEISIPQDRIQLARLYEWAGRVSSAQGQYALLANREKPEPAHLMSHIAFLLRQRHLDRAIRRFEQLERTSPGWLVMLRKRAPDRAPEVEYRLRLDIARLKARLCLLQGNTAEIVAVVERLADELADHAGSGAEERAELYANLGQICAEACEFRESERWHRRAYDLDSSKYEPLAIAIGRQGRVAEAIDLCKAAGGSAENPQAAVAIARVLAAIHPPREQLALADEFLGEAARRHGENVNLLSWVAYIRCLQGRIADAVKLYERALTLAPQNAPLLNNLAVALLDDPSRRKEALAHVEHALELAGPKPWLLDTKGTILVLEGRAQEAMTLLEEAANVEPDPQRLLHLAAAYHQADDLEKASEVYDRALKAGLMDHALSPTDRAFYETLSKPGAP